MGVERRAHRDRGVGNGLDDDESGQADQHRVEHLGTQTWGQRVRYVQEEDEADDGDRLIELRAIRVAAYVYAALSMGAVSLLVVGANGGAVGYAVLLALVIAEIANYGSRVVYYRRGA